MYASQRAPIFLTVLTFLLFQGCQSAYYATMEKMGVHKREILVDRVEEARDSQQEAIEQFESALDRFSAVLGFDGGTLEDNYEELKAELERSEDRADDVRKRIRAVEDVSEALFDEWEGELKDYTNKTLRRKSEEQLRSTRMRYDKLITAMRRAEDKIDPVLNPLRDQVLFLKHNLNAQAIASLETELGAIEADVASLIQDMEASIAEADKFIDEMSVE